MQIGISLGYWRHGPREELYQLVAEAERLGYESIWTAEAYGSDALTPLAWLGSRTSRLQLGTAVMQMPARTPTATAMAAMTMDQFSGGRFILGLGVSGPQVAEGWYGQPFARPLARTREYVGIVRATIAREREVEAPGPCYPLPLPGGTGLGKPLKSILHPLRTDLPLYLGAEGPRNMALAAEIADGLLTGNYPHRHDGMVRKALAEGFARPGARRGPADFQVAAPVAVVIDDDVEQAAESLRPGLALTIGGMGARAQNFHANVFARAGWEAEVAAIQDHYAAGRYKDAAAAVTLPMIEEIALIGSKAKVRDELTRWSESAVTSLLLRRPRLELAREFAELAFG